MKQSKTEKEKRKKERYNEVVHFLYLYTLYNLNEYPIFSNFSTYPPFHVLNPHPHPQPFWKLSGSAPDVGVGAILEIFRKYCPEKSYEIITHEEKWYERSRVSENFKHTEIWINRKP